MNVIAKKEYVDYINTIVERLIEKQQNVQDWLNIYESHKELPLYSSVDIRNSGFKLAVVDTNLFPSGFNNLCEHGLEDSSQYFRQAILKRVEKCQDILIIAEEHTRNIWYLENIRILKDIIQKSGFNVKVATFLNVQPPFCQNANYIELETASGHPIKIFCFRKILQQYESGKSNFDLIIMNNDLTIGIPEVLRNSQIPIYPSLQAGWHARLKSLHFSHTKQLIDEFAQILNLDPWMFSCFYANADHININSDLSRQKVMDLASDLFARIRKKYRQHQIDEKPYILIKSDSGTYGMGVLPIEDPSDVLKMNRKNRNKLHVGKGSRVIERYLLQEGVPTIYSHADEVSEVCIYQVENNLVGGFYRTHPTKSARDNLNSKGMVFQKMCPHSNKYGDCGVHHDINIFDVYRILARIAAIAACREVVELENSIKSA